MKKTFLIIAVLVVVVLVGLVLTARKQRQAASPPLSFNTPVQIPGQTTGSGTASSYTPGNYSESIVTADGRTRTYIVHVPTNFTVSKSYPLVLALHGGYGTAEQVMKQTNFAAKADSEGFIVVAPNGIDKHWSDGNHDSMYDDVGFVEQLIAHVKTVLPIDSKRIYATGISNGGHFAQRLGCEMPEVFAAIAPDVAALPQDILDICTIPSMPMVGIQGAADPLAPIGGGDGKGEGGILLSAIDTMQTYAKANGCNLTPTITHIPPTVDDGTSVDKYTFSGCEADVVYYIVQGMGHGWPPTPPAVQRVSGKTSKNINATDVFWDFFSSHSRI